MKTIDKYILCPNDCYYGPLVPDIDDRKLYTKKEVIDRFNLIKLKSKEEYDIAIEIDINNNIFENEYGNIITEFKFEYADYIAHKIEY